MAACLVGCSVGLVIFGLQPLIFGSLVAEGRLPEAAVGLSVSVECSAMAAGSVLALRRLKVMRASLVMAVGAALLAGFSLASIPAAGLLPIVLLRALSGLSEGILIAPGIALVAHSRKPEKLSAVFLAIQTVMQASLSYSLPSQTLIQSSANAGFLVLAALAIMAVLLSLISPTHLGGDAPEKSGPLPPAAAMAILGAAALYLGALVTEWGFFGVILTARGFDERVQGAMFALSLAVQLPSVFGGAHFAERSQPRPPIIACAIMLAGLILAFLSFGHSAPVVWACVVGYGLLWTVVQPFFTRALLQVDPSKRSALLLAPWQLTGAAFLPLLGSLGVLMMGPNGALVISALFAALAASLLSLSFLLR